MENKNYISLICFLLLNSLIFSQKKTDLIKVFDEKSLREEVKYLNISAAEAENFISLRKAQFLNENIKSQPTNGYAEYLTLRTMLAGNQNIDFETGSFSGWNLFYGINYNSVNMAGTFFPGAGTSALINGGIDPNVGFSLNSPLGGNYVARVNTATTQAQQCKLQKKVFVTSENNLLKFAYATVLQRADHDCSLQPYFAVTLRDTLGNLLFNYFVEAPDTLSPNSCSGYNQSNFVYNNYVYSNPWKIKCVDLSTYVGTNIIIEIIGASCTLTGHFGYGYFDAKLESCPDHGYPNNLTIGTHTVSINRNLIYFQNANCSNSMSLVAPGWPAYYDWNGPSGSGIITNSLQTIITQKNGLHTLSLGNSSICPVTKSIYVSGFNPILSPNNFTGTFCINQTYTFTVSGAVSYTWGNNQTGPSIAITPTAAGIFTLPVSATFSNACTVNKTYTFNVLGSPTLGITGNTITCNVSPTLQANGAVSYYWYSAGIGGTFTSVSASITPLLYTNTISLTGTDINGCVAQQVYTINNIVPLGNINSATSNTNICIGSPFNVFLNGPANTNPPNTYTVNTGINTFTVNNGTWTIFNPTISTTYTISGSNYCNTNSLAISVNVSTLVPVMNFTPLAPYCSWNYSVNLSGANSYTFSGAQTTTQNIVVLSPVSNGTTYVVNGKLNSSACIGTQTLNLSPVDSPTMVLTPVSPVCAASAATFNLSGGNGVYSITPLTSFFGTIAPTFTSPSTFTSTIPNNLAYYQVQGYDINGCFMSNNYPFTIVNPPSFSLAVYNSTVCAGQSATLQAFGLTSYSWSTGSTVNTIVVTPTATTTYTLIGANSCASIFTTGTVYYNPSPVANVTITPSVPVPCKGTNFSLTASGASSYTWTPGWSNNPVITANINGLSLFIVDYIDANGCKSSTPLFTIAPQAPTITISGPDTVCAQSPQVYSGGGANSYTWNVGLFGGTQTVVSNNYTLNTNLNINYSNSFTLTGIDGNGCSNKTTKTVVSLASGAITTNSTLPFCPGSSDTLYVTNISPAMNSFTWSNGPVSNSIVVSPSVNTIYTVQAKYNQFGCIIQTTAGVTLYSLTPVSFSLPGNSYCESEIPVVVNTTPTNAVVYPTYINNMFLPSISGTYTLDCYYINGTGCKSQAGTQTINVLPKPITTFSISQNNFCVGDPSVSLIGNPLGGQFTGTNVSGNSFIPSNPGNSSVIYSYTDLNGCSDVDEKCISVSALPQVTISGNDTLCFGQTAILTASGAATYSWNNGSNSNSISVTPVTNTVYTVIGAGACSNSTSFSVIVNPLPYINVVSSNSALCAGGTATFTCSGALTYTWSNGDTTYLEVISPSVTTSYTVYGTNIYGCQSSAVITESVNACEGFNESGKSSLIISIYPNPFNDKLTVELNTGLNINENKILPLEVYNPLGSLIYYKEEIGQKTEIDIGDISPGIYLIKIGDFITRIIKN